MSIRDKMRDKMMAYVKKGKGKPSSKTAKKC